MSIGLILPEDNQKNVSITLIGEKFGLLIDGAKQVEFKNDFNIGISGNRLSLNDIHCNEITIKNNDRELANNIKIDPIFYFVHSYGCENVDKDIVTGVLSYGKNYDVIIESENIFGTQFHPEKSQTAGLQILKNFSDL